MLGYAISLNIKLFWFILNIVEHDFVELLLLCLRDRRLAELLQDSQYKTVEDADEDGEDAEIEMDEETEILENMAQRAPRPTFHLLRLCDVSSALQSPIAETLDEQNYETAQTLGCEGWQNLMLACEKQREKSKGQTIL